MAKSALSLKRGELQKFEDIELLKACAYWLTGVGQRFVSEKNFTKDLADGVVLCNVLCIVKGSGVSSESFHKVAPNGSLKAKENLISFQVATKRLNLPYTFSLDDLEKQNLSKICSTILFLAHVCHSQGVGIDGKDTVLI